MSIEQDSSATAAGRMDIRQRYELMHAVKTQHGFGLTDGEFAERASRELGFRVLPATVKSYREAFGIEPVKVASAAELRARVRELEAQIASQSAA